MNFNFNIFLQLFKSHLDRQAFADDHYIVNSSSLAAILSNISTQKVLDPAIDEVCPLQKVHDSENCSLHGRITLDLIDINEAIPRWRRRWTSHFSYSGTAHRTLGDLVKLLVDSLPIIIKIRWAHFFSFTWLYSFNIRKIVNLILQNFILLAFTIGV